MFAPLQNHLRFVAALPPAPSENNIQAPDVTSVAPPTRGPRVDLPSNATVRGMSRGQSRSSMMETADGNRRPRSVAAPHSTWAGICPTHNLFSLENNCHQPQLIITISSSSRSFSTLSYVLFDWLVARGNLQSKETPSSI